MHRKKDHRRFYDDQIFGLCDDAERNDEGNVYAYIPEVAKRYLGKREELVSRATRRRAL